MNRVDFEKSTEKKIPCSVNLAKQSKSGRLQAFWLREYVLICYFPFEIISIEILLYLLALLVFIPNIYIY